jgi:hypothetical protein
MAVSSNSSQAPPYRFPGSDFDLRKEADEKLDTMGSDLPHLRSRDSGPEVRGHRFLWWTNQRGIDLSTSLFRRIDVQNGKTYGLSAGYLNGNRYGMEFMWSYNKADILAQPRGPGSDVYAALWIASAGEMVACRHHHHQSATPSGAGAGCLEIYDYLNEFDATAG